MGKRVAATFFLALAALALAWQVPVPISVNVGRSEELYLSHFYPGEQVGGRDYRWVRGGDDSRITLAGIGWCDWRVTLVAAAGRRPGGQVPLRILSHGATVFETPTADADFHDYVFTVPARNTSAGDLVLNFDIAEFVPPSDNRALGLAIDRVELVPSVPCVPPPLAWLSLAGALTLLYTALHLYSRWLALTITSAVALLTCYLVAAQRLFIAPYASYVVVACALLFVGLCVLRGFLACYRPRASADVMQQRAERWPATAALVLFSGALIFFGAQVATLSRKPFPYDFVLYYGAGGRLAAGQPLYDLVALQHKPLVAAFSIYKYPPTFALGMQPLAALSMITAFNVWVLANIGMIGLALFALLRAHGRRLSHATWVTLLFISVGSLFQPTIDTLFYGQLDIAITALIALTYWALRTGKPMLAGPPLALAALLKLYPAVLLIYLAARREWRALGSFLASAAALTAGSALFTHLEPWRTFVTQILPHTGASTVWVENQTFVAFLGRFFTDRLELEELSANPDLPVQFLTVAGWVWAALLLGAGLWLTRKRAERQSPGYALGFALFTVASVLVLPVAWYHYVTVMLVPLAVIFFTLEDRGGDWLKAEPRSFAALLTLLGVSTLLLTFGSYQLFWTDANPGGWWKLLLSYKFYGMVLLWTALVWILPHAAHRDAPANNLLQRFYGRSRRRNSIKDHMRVKAELEARAARKGRR